MTPIAQQTEFREQDYTLVNKEKMAVNRKLAPKYLGRISAHYANN
jgi:hypothetical protein